MLVSKLLLCNMNALFCFFSGVLCIDRNPYCKNLPQRQCESDTWMIENCAGTCSNKDCDNVLYRPAGMFYLTFPPPCNSQMSYGSRENNSTSQN